MEYSTWCNAVGLLLLSWEYPGHGKAVKETTLLTAIPWIVDSKGLNIYINYW